MNGSLARSIKVRVDDDTHAWLEAEARKTDRTVGAIVRAAIRTAREPQHDQRATDTTREGTTA